MMKNISPEKKCLLILAIFSFALFAVFIPISAVFNMWGLTIGWAMGITITFISTILLFASGKKVASAALDSNKGLGLSFLFYFVRFGLTIGILVLCAVMQYMVKIQMFDYSVFTCASAMIPRAIIVALFYRANDTSSSENK